MKEKGKRRAASFACAFRKKAKLEVVHLDPVHPEEEVLRRAAELLRAGGVIVIPTDTVYGLVCDPGNEEAMERIYEIKGRPREMPLILLVGGPEDIVRFCVGPPEAALRAARKFWPGPLTIVLPRSEAVSPALTAGRETIGLRQPNHPVPLALIRLAGFPLASTSANRSGQPAARSGEEAMAAVGDEVDLILEAGPSPLGVESTVADFRVSPPRILRKGAISGEELCESAEG